MAGMSCSGKSLRKPWGKWVVYLELWFWQRLRFMPGFVHMWWTRNIYKNINIINCILLTETWLQAAEDVDTDRIMNLTGYTLIRSARTEASNKKRGRGVCVYINNRWCKNINVIEKHWDQNIELLTLGPSTSLPSQRISIHNIHSCMHTSINRRYSRRRQILWHH